MDLEYDRKFEEMKKYIPFLESMIKRLESTNNGVKNPRRAQLEKIRSLRDLLLDKKKRMKMENLLKCEQVLVNLYAKVEQRDLMTDAKEDCTEESAKEKSDLNIVRHKLKSVVSKFQDDVPETLPEIARATNTEVICTPGSKEPALFQRRPNKASPLRQSPISHNDEKSLSSKRHYTRVLMSPEHKKKDWLTNSDIITEKQLFSRRPPRRSPRKYSPSYKKERKKSFRQRSKSQQSEDLNITLNVPKESLGSLNTKDILSRIINCSDSDVDIDTLRGLRSQILGELKQTGTNDDISDLILKSYKKKEKSSKKKDEVEEGELSDSESEAIENIYGNLVVVNQGDDNSNDDKALSDKKHPRKIQICLVINSDKEKDKVNDQIPNTTPDITDFEPYIETKIARKISFENTGDNSIKESRKEIKDEDKLKSLEEIKSPLKPVDDISHKSSMNDTIETEQMQKSPLQNSKISSTGSFKPNFYQPFREEKTNPENIIAKQNSCKFTNESVDKKTDEVAKKAVEVPQKHRAKTRIKKEVVSEIDILQALKKEILGETTTVSMPEAITPPLHQPKITKVACTREIVSKKRISIEKYKQKSVPSVKQPLFNSGKQQSSSSKDDNSKKQSLKLTEKECERFNFPVTVSPVDSSEDEDKQKWDFEFLHGSPKSSDSKNKDKPFMDYEFLHSDSAPKSPDHEDFADTGIRPPVIIPSDPVKNVVPNAKADIDMRTLMLTTSPVAGDRSKKMFSSSLTNEMVLDSSRSEKCNSNETIRKSMSEIRIRTESNLSATNNSPNSYMVESDRVPRHNKSYINVPSNISPNITANIPPLMSLNVAPHITPTQNPNLVSNINSIMTPILNSNIPLIMNSNMTPSMTPTITPGLMSNINPSMTPSRMVPSMNPMMTTILTPNARSYEMTPRPNFDNDDYSNQKHVYAPIFPTFEPHDSSEKDTLHLNQWENNESSKWEDRNLRGTSLQQDIDYHRNRNDRYTGDKRLDSPQIRMDCPSTPNPSFGRLECPPTSNSSFSRMECPPTPNPSFGRMECPATPNPSFGRIDCPPTPNPSFGRMECPPTPNPSFGRMECPPTPNPSFGRMECPLTPNPSFGRMETPMTPVHSFGRSDCPRTPNYPFGRSDSNVAPTHVFGRGGDYYHSASSFSHNYVKSQDPRLNRSADYDKYQSRNDERNRSYSEDDPNIIDNPNRYNRNQVKSYEQDCRNSRKRMPGSEPSVGRCVPKDCETEDSYHKDYYKNENQFRRDKYKCIDDVNNKRNYRARSVGRINLSEDKVSMHKDRELSRTYIREGSIEKPLSVQSHSGRSFSIDTSFNRTFQETKSSTFNKSFDARRQRASSVGRSLRESPLEDINVKLTKKIDSDVPDHKTMQFRRACSVGRDLKHYNVDKNFKDIKEDLRSSKFNNYNFNSHDRDREPKNKSRMGYTNAKVNLNEYRGSRDKCENNTSFSKYPGHQINRDSRKKGRDCDLNIIKKDDSSKYSPRKNFRDPRLRREVDIKNTSRDKYKNKDKFSSSSYNKHNGIVYSNDNIAKGTILASAVGVKNFKIPKIKRPVEENEVETTNQSKTDHKNEEPSKMKEDNINTDPNNKVESKSTKSDTNASDKRHNAENINKSIAIKEDKPKSKEQNESLIKMADKVKSHEDNTDLVKSISDSCDRRVTRYALRSVNQTKEMSTCSPVKKLRRIKRPIVYDSDSDPLENESNNENTEQDIDANKISKVTQDIKSEPVMDKKGDFEKFNSKQVNEKEPIEVIDSLNKENVTFNSNNESIIYVNKKEKMLPVTTNESCGEHTDSLDISFGGDDELFSDNIASGSVLDNINALIADLDHDIEAPKINDSNDKFINNIVGTTASNNSTILPGNQTDFTSDVTLHEKVGFVVGGQNSIKCSSAQIDFQNDSDEFIKSKNNSEHVNYLNQSKQVLGKNNEIANNESQGSTLNSNNHDNAITVNRTKVSSEIQDVNKDINADAIVSTTACDEKSDEMFKDSHLIPDSTVNSKENNINTNDKDSQESIPDSTNELSSEMNITSTHNSIDASCKGQSCVNSACIDDLPRIDSIGKLLSILEDKNKIKELLAYIGKDSGENEKIKKKLEKLSEIVSVEEQNSIEAHKDTNLQEKQIFVTKGEKESEDIAAGKSPISDHKNETIVDCKEHDNNLDEKRCISQLNTKKDDELPTSSKSAANNEINKADADITDKGVAENKSFTESIAENEDLVKEANTDIGKEQEENDVVRNIKDVKDNLQVDYEQVLETNKKEKQMTETLLTQIKSGKKCIKKSKITKRGRSKLAKNVLLKDKRVTRSETGSVQPKIASVPKKPSRELLKLQEDIRDMFISEDILNATGIRMCRLAKLVDDKHSKPDTPSTEAEPEPIVVLENIKSKMSTDQQSNTIEKNNKKKISKSKSNVHNETSIDSECREKPKYKPGPKSRTKKQDDPYIFETESLGESNNTVDSNDQNTDSDSDSFSTKSFESSELLVELKKKTKRKRRSWQLGVIRKKGTKVKSAAKNTELSLPAAEDTGAQDTKDKKLHDIPDLNCFTDKSYCFHKNTKTYLCRLCEYHGYDIVPHYKKHHPHSEIPLSRLSPATAKEAIEQCENMNLQAISKIQTTKYVCRFCFQEFHKQNTALETFFWHVVSVHTGEFKHICPECVNVTRCPFHLDIPPPPKNLKGQLIGYICGRCNFTQVSLENLKTHVIIRHDDEQTEVYSINLSEIPKKILQSLLMKASELSTEGLRVLRSTRSNQSITEASDDVSDITDNADRIQCLDTGRDKQEISNQIPPINTAKNKIQSKFIFENDDMSDTSSYSKNDEIIKASIKLERDDDTQDSHHNDGKGEGVESVFESESDQLQPVIENVEKEDVLTELTPSNDVLDYPHFKIKLTGTGIKEYICCINGTDNHYKTTLLISFKKHVQLKHSENWDGYCFVCKVIVIGQGKHQFKDCLQHFLDKHMDDFPIFQENPKPTVTDVSEPSSSKIIEETSPPKPYINVRPLSELISSEQSETEDANPSMPKIQSVVSLGGSDETVTTVVQKDEKEYNYEPAQAEVMSKKHRVVLEAMLNPEKLIQIFKCAGRFCSYTTDNAEEALLHASTHQRIGGECSLKCAYCDFDSSGNAIDLVMHVFKHYSHCSYACSKCFYRAAASQLVYAHIKRVHTDVNADKVPVLSSTTFVKDSTKDDLLSRDAAVLYYICNNRDPEDGGVCQFKSYVLTKFREHLQTRHANDQVYSCYMCDVSMSSLKLLTQHLKSHGLRIYQCCRCLFGADNESELMAHASEKHPLKQPKAYLRIITTKGGSSDVRVLPLAVLSKSTVESTVVTPSTDTESPVKHAERSIDLEKLIGQTNRMIESMNTITNSVTIKPIDLTANEKQIQLEIEETSCSTSQAESESTSSAVLTLLRDPQETSNKPSVVVKVEPVDSEQTTSDTLSVASTAGPTEPDVVCLDSDEDSPRQNVIDLSGEDTPTVLNSTKKQDDVTDIKIPRTQLYKCSKCSLISKSEGMFKRHIISCFLNSSDLIKCAYCSFSTNASRIAVHYNNNHLECTTPYTCGICNGKFVSLTLARKHMKLIHNETSTKVTLKTLSNGVLQHVIDSDLKERNAPKRKLSSETGNKTSEPSPKLKKYGPLDVDKLPINPILDDFVYCSLCEFNTKVRLNLVRHLQLHAEQQPVPRTAPVNPVPHLESNEKHFDKMLNLASSSITTSKTSKDGTIITTEYLSPEAAAKYPKYVPNKHRYTCGAKGCSYISVNESMFKIHWETLHAGTNDYHCVHCPPYQHLDTTKPLTAVRIIAHLKMHDIKLYACSSCPFYHYTRKLTEKHLKEVHSGKLIIVREDGAMSLPTPPASAQSSAAPTMDLKPWQCGLCIFKSMIRPEVIEHCSKFHQSKMQFKCTYCGFRTSNIENISKHQTKQHPGKKEDVFYFYYREGSIPNEADGTARWEKQSQKSEAEIKTEADVPPNVMPLLSNPAPAKPINIVNLDIVKKEIIEPDTNVDTEESIEDLCNHFGQFCDPNGLKYKCSLCKVIIEDTKEAMQSHLYEELQYRKWGCAVCSYKAFHKPGLQQHVQTEHLQSREAKEPIELQVDHRIETWVTKLLEHQTIVIERNKENLAKQKAEILRANPGSSVKTVEKQTEPLNSAGAKPNVSMAELEKLFGSFGVPSNMNYTCPKCNIRARSEAVMQEHLEGELNKIRWCCNVCSDTFQTYHEAQFHCRSVHPGQSSRPVEATRDSSIRAAWVTAVLRVQKLSMNCMPITDAHPPEIPTQSTDNSTENSLLVVRYEENVPTPEELMKLSKNSEAEGDKRPTDEPEKKKGAEFECQYCTATYKYESFFQGHILKHYGLKPFTCPYCPHNDYRKGIETHVKNQHPNRALVYANTPIPTHPPTHDYLKNATGTSKPLNVDPESKIICLGCEQEMTRAESQTHYHDNVRPQFGIKGSVVYRCWTCLTLHKSSADFNLHHKQFHTNEKKNSSFYKLHDENRCLFCSFCNQNFGNMAVYRSHQQLKHGLKSCVLMEPVVPDIVIEIDDEVEGGKRKAEDTSILPVPKRVAKKSTTKLPKVFAVARKSTTKLPYNAPCEVEEYSYYGTKPSMDNLENVTTLMPFCNTFVPFTLKKLSEIIKIYPLVVVEDINKK